MRLPVCFLEQCSTYKMVSILKRKKLLLWEQRLFLRVDLLQQSREYARGRRERHRFRPADVAFFSSESDKNVALIFRKILCFNRLGVKRVTEPNRTNQLYRTEPTKISDCCGTGFYLPHRTEPTNAIFTAYFIIISFQFIKLITYDSRFYLFKYHLLYLGS